MHRIGRRAVWAAAIALGIGCSDTSGPSSVRDLGMLPIGGSGIDGLTAPATATAGAPFVVTIRTIGTSSCTSPDGESISFGAAGISVRAYDRYVTNVPCTEDLATITHEVELTWPEPGAVTVHAVGRAFTIEGETVVDSLAATVTIE